MITTGGDASLLERLSRGGPQQKNDAIAHATPFCSFGWNCFSSNRQDRAKQIREARTGVVFPGEFCLERGKSQILTLTGIGTRQKRLAGIKSLDVYALALYVDERGAHSLLHGKVSGKSQSDVVNDESIYTDLIKAKRIEKSLVIVITSGLVKRKAFVDALNEQLEPPVSGTKSVQTLNTFKNMFDSVAFRKGLEITFTFVNGNVITKVDGMKLGKLQDGVFSDALLGIYLGQKPVSEKAKKAFGEGLYRLSV